MKKLFLAALAAALCFCLCGCQSSDYKKATALFEAGDYQQAKEICEKLTPYKDSALMLRDCEAKLIEEDLNQILTQEMLLECSGGSSYEMIITNTSDRDLSNIWLYFSLYSEDGLLLDTVSENFQAWASGGKNKAILRTSEKFASVRVNLKCGSTAKSSEAVSQLVDLPWVNNYHIVINLVNDLPQEFTYKLGWRERGRCSVETFRYEDTNWYDGKASVTLFISGTKTYDYEGDSKTNATQVSWKLLGGEKQVIDSGSFYVKGCQVGETFAIESYVSKLESGTYTLELSNYES